MFVLVMTNLPKEEHVKANEKYFNVDNEDDFENNVIPMNDLNRSGRSRDYEKSGSTIRNRSPGSKSMDETFNGFIQDAITIYEKEGYIPQDYNDKMMVDDYPLMNENTEENIMKDFEDENVIVNDKFSFTSINTLGPILLYMIIAFINMQYLLALSLYFSASVPNGGLGLDPMDSEFLFTSMASSKLFAQLFILKR
jgi:hypothetical protein